VSNHECPYRRDVGRLDGIDLWTCDCKPSNFPPDPSPLALAAVLAVAALVIGVAVAAGMWFGLATR
jgi:hypothetical protein